jgi:hypothetical protein
MPSTDLTTSIKAIGQFYKSDAVSMLGNLREVSLHQQDDIALIEAMRARFIELGQTNGLSELDETIDKFKSGELVDACSNISWFTLLVDGVGKTLDQYAELLEGIEPEPAPAPTGGTTTPPADTPVPPAEEAVAPPPP